MTNTVTNILLGILILALGSVGLLFNDKINEKSVSSDAELGAFKQLLESAETRRLEDRELYQRALDAALQKINSLDAKMDSFDRLTRDELLEVQHATFEKLNNLEMDQKDAFHVVERKLDANNHLISSFDQEIDDLDGVMERNSVALNSALTHLSDLQKYSERTQELANYASREVASNKAFIEQLEGQISQVPEYLGRLATLEGDVYSLATIFDSLPIEDFDPERTDLAHLACVELAELRKVELHDQKFDGFGLAVNNIEAWKDQFDTSSIRVEIGVACHMPFVFSTTLTSPNSTARQRVYEFAQEIGARPYARQNGRLMFLPDGG